MERELVSLKKLERGESVSLRKENGIPVSKIRLELSWKKRITEGDDFDLDTEVFMLAADSKVIKSKDFIFYGNTVSVCGSIRHHGDQLTGGVEIITVNTETIQEQYKYVNLCATIFKAKQRKQRFGMIEDAKLTVFDAETNEIIGVCELGEDFSTETTIIMGSVYRSSSGDFRFKYVGQGSKDGLKAIAEHYGVPISEDEDD